MKYLGVVELSKDNFYLVYDKKGTLVFFNEKDAKEYIPSLAEIVLVQEKLFELIQKREIKSNKVRAKMDKIFKNTGSLLLASIITLDIVQGAMVSQPGLFVKGFMSLATVFATEVPAEKDITEIIPNNPTREEIIKIAESSEENKEYLPELEQFLDALLAFDPDADLRILAENLKRGDILSVSKNAMNFVKGSRTNGFFDPVTSNIRYVSGQREVITHELDHASVLINTPKLKKSFTYTNDNYDGLGAFMIEAGPYYFGELTGLLSQKWEMVFQMKMLANVIGVKELLNIYRNKTVSDLAAEINMVLANEEETKELLSLIDKNFYAIYKGYEKISNEEKVLLYEKLFDFMVDGLKLQYDNGMISLNEVRAKILYIYDDLSNYGALKEIKAALKDYFSKSYRTKFARLIDIGGDYFYIEQYEDGYNLRLGNAVVNPIDYVIAYGEYIDEAGFTQVGNVLIHNNYWDMTDEEITDSDIPALRADSLGNVVIKKVKPVCRLIDYLSNDAGSVRTRREFREKVELDKSPATFINILKKAFPDNYDYLFYPEAFISYLKQGDISKEALEAVKDAYSSGDLGKYQEEVVKTIYDLEYRKVNDDIESVEKFLGFMGRMEQYAEIEELELVETETGTDFQSRTRWLGFEYDNKLEKEFNSPLVKKLRDNYAYYLGEEFGRPVFKLEGDLLNCEHAAYLLDEEGSICDIIRVNESYAVKDLVFRFDQNNNLVLCDKANNNEIVKGSDKVVYPLKGEISWESVIQMPYLRNRIMDQDGNLERLNYYLGEALTLLKQLDSSLRTEICYYKVDDCEESAYTRIIFDEDDTYRDIKNDDGVLVTSIGFVYLDGNLEGNIIPANTYLDVFSRKIIDTDVEVYDRISMGEFLELKGVTLNDRNFIIVNADNLDKRVSLKYD